MTDERETYKRWLFEGNCPCCFPYWDYDVNASDVWDWQDEFHAWDVYEEIMSEPDDD